MSAGPLITVLDGFYRIHFQSNPMAILEVLVITVIVLTGAYVGYHAWQDSLGAPDSEPHSADPELMYHNSQILPAESHRALMPVRFH